MRIPVAPEGWPFVFPPAAAACILGVMGWWGAAIVFGVVALALLGFFRDPERVPPADPGAVLAPADGKVMAITPVEDAWVGAAIRLSVFLSPLDVHVNRAPVDGVVRSVEYASGKFHAAYRADASEVNERCTIALEAPGSRVAVRQIAGVLARRIVCRVRSGDRLRAGERYGLIRFGSRTDLLLPRRAEMRVQVGDRVRGGESIVGILKG